jgi:ribosomal protein S18 acetylase RimI-like enzyme
VSQRLGKHLVLDGATIPARAHRSPADPATAQLVILDSTRVPTSAHFEDWASRLAAQGFETMRTGALAPRQALQAEAAGLHCVQELVLLEANPPYVVRKARHRTRRARTRATGAMAAVDRAAFPSPWQLDAEMLDDVRTATPASRVRVVAGLAGRRSATPVAGFLISGRAGRNGYIQRLAVMPDAQRLGVATALLADGLAWLRRWRADRVFVNTHVENAAALELYRSTGFSDLPDRLRVFEGPTRR